MKTVFLVLAIASPLVTGCGERDSLRALTEAEDTAITNLRSGTHEVVSKSAFEQLRQDAQLGKSVGRYQQYVSGFRTWRLDTATGRTCLLLASDADWKKPDVAAQGCQGN